MFLGGVIARVDDMITENSEFKENFGKMPFERNLKQNDDLSKRTIPTRFKLSKLVRRGGCKEGVQGKGEGTTAVQSSRPECASCATVNDFVEAKNLLSMSSRRRMLLWLSGFVKLTFSDKGMTPWRLLITSDAMVGKH